MTQPKDGNKIGAWRLVVSGEVIGTTVGVVSLERSR